MQIKLFLLTIITLTIHSTYANKINTIDSKEYITTIASNPDINNWLNILNVNYQSTPSLSPSAPYSTITFKIKSTSTKSDKFPYKVTFDTFNSIPLQDSYNSLLSEETIQIMIRSSYRIR